LTSCSPSSSNSAFRGRVWLFLANSYVRRRPGLFEKLVKTSQEAKGRKGREVYYEAIEKDLDRCFPEHKLFRGEDSTGRADLEAILKAYVHYNPIIGYTQGMGMLVGILLIHMPAEDAFWLLCALLREPHMEGYYANELKQLHVDGVVFDNLLATMDPELHQRLTSLGIECSNFTPNWLLPLFVRMIPWATLMRVWDIFFFEGELQSIACCARNPSLTSFLSPFSSPNRAGLDSSCSSRYHSYHQRTSDEHSNLPRSLHRHADSPSSTSSEPHSRKRSSLCFQCQTKGWRDQETLEKRIQTGQAEHG